MSQTFKNSILIIFAFAMINASEAKQKFAPENTLYLQDNKKMITNITETQFNEIIDKIIAIYAPLATQKGATLTSHNHWSDSTVNAYAEQSEDGLSWTIDMFGGLARRPEVTLDGFALVVCHELGHHFGGFAFYQSAGDDWAATEGQSDYYATLACAREVWKNEVTENANARANVQSYVKNKCDTVWKTEAEQNLCYRISAAGESLAHLLATLGGSSKPKFDTPSRQVARRTQEGHPEAQCRLDTYFNGALCNANPDLTVIPGRNHAKGQGSLEAEQESAKHTCFKSDGYTLGLRPACWFNARL